MKFNDFRGWRLCRCAVVAGLFAWGNAADAGQNEVDPSAAASRREALASAQGPNSAASGTIQELGSLIRNKKVTELRTTYNGRHGASLLLAPGDMTYYVTLFTGEHFWRAAKLSDERAAENLYEEFVRRTRALAEIEIRRLTLEAEKAVVEHDLGDAEARLLAARNDLAIQRQQELRLDADQQAERNQVSALKKEYTAARHHLSELEARILAVEAAQHGTKSGAIDCVDRSAESGAVVSCTR
ncbi:DUF2968 domain-containing protein [Pandoraea fibrosis]|uniref:Uncharacterized protein n=1 Tax=Pandoraea fibrosis TaxID=1891094 RepID=A0A5E4YY51_9BURK|nr:DUF2968 domain-containing protein [Pandoraea fibrosis]VVE53378.1 hypothetical protein PFI31113_04825 [Pandoraea fibrosis]